MRSSIFRLCENSKTAKPFPKVYFDLKAFRKGVADKKRSLIEAEKREVGRAYAKAAPVGWSIETFIDRTRIADLSRDAKLAEERSKFSAELAACFEDWNDFISSDRKDLFRVSNLLTPPQTNKLAHCIELFNHGLFEVSEGDTPSVFAGQKGAREGCEWTDEEDSRLVELAVNKYDYTFGDPWIYVAWEMERDPDEVHKRFVEVYVRPRNTQRESELALSKSFKPLLMNRQFRLIPPQCYVVPSERNFPSPRVTDDDPIPEAFRQYRPSGSF